MKICPICGAQNEDNRTICKECGFGMELEEENATNSKQEVVYRKQDKKTGFAVSSLILGIIGLILSCLIVGIVPSIIGLIFGIVTLVNTDLKKDKAMSIIGIICSVISIFIATIVIVVAVMSGGSVSSNSDLKSDGNRKEENAIEKIQGISRDQFISECEDFDYKSLARDPDGNKGKKIKVEVKVQQILQDGSKTYYRVNMDDEYGFWSGGEFLMLDKRKDDKTKILVDDVLKVYAEFSGSETLIRAFTDTEEEVPTIDAYYVEFLEDGYTTSTPTESLSEEILNDGTIDTNFGNFTLKYTGYEISKDYEGKSCIIVYFDYTNNSNESKAYEWSAGVKAFQNGVECDTAFILDSQNTALGNSSKEVKSGTTIGVASAFLIEGMDDIELECGKWLGDTVDTMIIELQ